MSDKDKLIGLNEVRERLGGISRMSVTRLVERGELPKPSYMPGQRKPFWSDKAISELVSKTLEAE